LGQALCKSRFPTPRIADDQAHSAVIETLPKVRQSLITPEKGQAGDGVSDVVHARRRALTQGGPVRAEVGVGRDCKTVGQVSQKCREVNETARRPLRRREREEVVPQPAGLNSIPGGEQSLTVSDAFNEVLGCWRSEIESE
jgi:hypothetical protein